MVLGRIGEADDALRPATRKVGDRGGITCLGFLNGCSLTEFGNVVCLLCGSEDVLGEMLLHRYLILIVD